LNGLDPNCVQTDLEGQPAVACATKTTPFAHLSFLPTPPPPPAAPPPARPTSSRTPASSDRPLNHSPLSSTPPNLWHPRPRPALLLLLQRRDLSAALTRFHPDSAHLGRRRRAGRAFLPSLLCLLREEKLRVNSGFSSARSSPVRSPSSARLHKGVGHCCAQPRPTYNIGPRRPHP
jgi:hypothetical protein